MLYVFFFNTDLQQSVQLQQTHPHFFLAVAQEDEVPILNSPARDLTLSVLYPYRKTFVNKHNRTPIQRSGTNLNLHYNRNTASRYM